MSSVYKAEPKYTGDGGNAQKIFIKDAQVGWKNILDDLNRHLSNGALSDYIGSCACMVKSCAYTAKNAYKINGAYLTR